MKTFSPDCVFYAPEDKQNVLACPLCEHTISSGTVECNSSHPKVRLTWLHESREAYEQMYSEGERYHRDEQLREGQKAFWERDGEHLGASHARLKFLEAVIGPLQGRTLLDIGAGTGAFASLARYAYGMEAEGIEPNRAAVVQGKSLGRPVEVGSWESVTGRWDIVTLHDVFEHLLEPIRCIEVLKGCLSAKGVLLIEMPELYGPMHEAQGENFKHLRPRQHPILYTREAAEELYTRAGLQVMAFHRPLLASIGKMTHILKG